MVLWWPKCYFSTIINKNHTHWSCHIWKEKKKKKDPWLQWTVTGKSTVRSKLLLAYIYVFFFFFFFKYYFLFHLSYLGLFWSWVAVVGLVGRGLHLVWWSGLLWEWVYRGVVVGMGCDCCGLWVWVWLVQFWVIFLGFPGCDFLVVICVIRGFMLRIFMSLAVGFVGDFLGFLCDFNGGGWRWKKGKMWKRQRDLYQAMKVEVVAVVLVGVVVWLWCNDILAWWFFVLIFKFFFLLLFFKGWNYLILC